MTVRNTLVEIAVVVLDGVRAAAVYRLDGAEEPLTRALPVALDARLDVEARRGESNALRAARDVSSGLGRRLGRRLGQRKREPERRRRLDRGGCHVTGPI